MKPRTFFSSQLPAVPAMVVLLLAGRVQGQESELKDETEKTIVRYIAEALAGVASPGVSDPAKQVGLFLCFQEEHGRPTGDDLFPVRESLRRLGLRDSYVLIAAHSRDPKGKMGAADREPLMRLIAWAEKTYPINPRRIYAFGKGEGGKISGEMGALHPELITAGITYSWGWWAMPSELTEPLDPENSAKFYMVLGLRDLPHHLTTVRNTYERVNAKGYRVIYREFEELGERSYHPVSNDDAIGWATRLRNSNVALSEAEKKLLEPFSRSNLPTASGGFYPAIALVGGSPAGAVLRKLFESADSAVREAAAETCSHAIFDETTTGALGRLLHDPSIQVRRAALAAQQALIGVTTDASAKMEDRIAAADGIAQAVALQAEGVPQDPPLFRALVSLLDQEHDEPLSAIAYLALAPVRDPSYHSDSAPGSLPEREAPPGGWQHWLDEISTKQAGDSADYKVCEWGHPAAKAASGPIEQFCLGGASLLGVDPATGKAARHDPAAAFKFSLQAAEQGYVLAEEAVGMMYANGKGVQQDYAQAGKWWIQAAEGGNLHAASNAAMLYRNGEGVPRNREIADKWAKYVADHVVTDETRESAPRH